MTQDDITAGGGQFPATRRSVLEAVRSQDRSLRALATPRAGPPPAFSLCDAGGRIRIEIGS